MNYSIPKIYIFPYFQAKENYLIPGKKCLFQREKSLAATRAIIQLFHFKAFPLFSVFYYFFVSYCK